MSDEQRMSIDLALKQRELEAQREEIRRQFPNADDAEIDRRFRLRMLAHHEEKTAAERAIASPAILAPKRRR